MTNCQRCNSKRVYSVSAHCRDLCIVTHADHEHEGYVPDDLGIGGGDDVEIDVCLDCGQLQGTWPLPTTDIERKTNGETTNTKKQWLQTQNQLLQSNLDIVADVNILASKPDTTVYTIVGHLIEHGFDDPSRIAAGIISLKRNSLHEVLGEAVLDKFYDWEQYQFLEKYVEFDE